MDLFHTSGATFIEAFQTSFSHHRDNFFLISILGDPRYAFLIYAPMIFALDSSVGKKVAWITVLAEWSNQVLKWLLHGERPYWWVHETPIYNKTGTSAPNIEQFFLTCETGPGSPSGHAMVSAAVWYIIVSASLNKWGGQKIKKNKPLALIVWTVYTTALFVISLSRIFIAAHFPHQCLSGMMIGFSLGIFVRKLRLENLKLFHYVAATIGLFASAMGTYFLLKSYVRDPLWSVDLAMRWCARPEYIHLDTTPFFSMMRYCGFTLGIGIGLLFKSSQQMKSMSKVAKVAAAILSVVLGKSMEFVPLPKGNLNLFYALAFVQYTIFSVLFVAVIPALLAIVFRVKHKAR